MARSHTSRRWDELVLTYALLGIESWTRTERTTRKAARAALGIDIADDTHTASEVVKKPFRADADGALVLIPMPLLPEKRGLAFFAPINVQQGEDAVAFDLALLVDGGRHALGFRFEPADVGEDRTHGYDHMQLSTALGHRSAPLRATADWLPDSYPAFPIRSKDMRDRFLAMALAMHGFPEGVADVVERIATRGSPLAKDCISRIDEMVGHGTRRNA